MPYKAPFTELHIKKSQSGFYEGYSLPIALVSKITMSLLVVWALIWPLSANGTLSGWNWSLLQGFNTFYIIAVGIFAFSCFAVAIIPASGKRVLGQPGEKPESSIALSGELS